jgi:hypothetical protein
VWLHFPNENIPEVTLQPLANIAEFLAIAPSFYDNKSCSFKTSLNTLFYLLQPPTVSIPLVTVEIIAFYLVIYFNLMRSEHLNQHQNHHLLFSLDPLINTKQSILSSRLSNAVPT